MNRRKVLYVCHNHPRLRPGGAEAYALELYEALRDRSSAFEPLLLAQARSPVDGVPARRDTAFAPVPGGDPRQHYFLCDPVDFDYFLNIAKGKHVAARSFRDLLLATRPDVVHFQHTLFVGYDLIRVAREVLGPEAAIVYTLHEYLPICHHHGQMVRTFDHSLCTHATAQRCHECYPKHSPEDFWRRKQVALAFFDDIDLFIAPSLFLLEKYVEWGIPRDKMRFEDYGRTSMPRVPETGDRSRRNRLGFFGQFTPFKGADLLLNAMGLLDGVDARLRLHGANLEHQPVEFQKRFNGMLNGAGDRVEMIGRYGHDDLPRMMSEVDWVVVPSIWWENSPLVIQEAFMHGRPVICAGIGGMAEKVRDGIDGLHFVAGDARSLADTIRRAVATPGPWARLARGIRPVYDIMDHVAVMESIYAELLAGKSAPLEVVA